MAQLTSSTALVVNTRKSPFEIPFERDPDFIGRIDIISELDEKLKVQRRVALAGIGGVG